MRQKETREYKQIFTKVYVEEVFLLALNCLMYGQYEKLGFHLKHLVC